MMKRFLILFMILGLIAGSVATADAGQAGRKRAERTVEGSYATQFVPFSGLVTAPCAESGAIGCVTVQTRAQEEYLTATVTDAHGQPVLVAVDSWDPHTGAPTEYGTFCGETEEAIRFRPGVELRFAPGYWDPYLPTPWATCPPGFGTTGTISVTLSNLP
jgi:hypothetical protein